MGSHTLLTETGEPGVASRSDSVISAPLSVPSDPLRLGCLTPRQVFLVRWEVRPAAASNFPLGHIV